MRGLSNRLRPLARFGAAALALTAMAGPALAVCPICNASVRFDKDLAICFAERYENELQRLKSEGLGFVIVNLSDCKGRSALPTAPQAPSAVLDSSFVADADTLECLGEAIAGYQGPMDPSYLFDLAQICT